MLRWVYIQLIWLHPAPFRWRFGDDMLDDFDRAPKRNRPRYLADAVGSLARQWLLRPEFRHPEAPGTTAESSLETAGAPVFQIMEIYRPRPAALIQGGLLALVSILAAVVLIGKAGRVASPFPAGVDVEGPSLLPIDRDLVAASDPENTVKSGPDAVDAWLKLARPYFASMPVLRALDTDRDLALSPWEIGNAPAALRRLDSNREGKLTAEKCGLQIDPNSVIPAIWTQLRRQFMSYHPVLAALDADHNGEISSWEIDHAAAALQKLDRNRDGYLTPDVLLPSEMTVRGGRR
jgi:hypothetical protein